MNFGTPDFDILPRYTPLSKRGPYRATDYFALPEGSRGELINGWLIAASPPTREFSQSGEDLCRAAKNAFAFWATHSLQLSSRRRLIVEIQTPRPHRLRSERIANYSRLGIEEYWLIDPVERATLFFVLEAGRYIVHTGVDNHYQSPRLPEVEFDLTAFWGEVDRQLGDDPPA